MGNFRNGSKHGSLGEEKSFPVYPLRPDIVAVTAPVSLGQKQTLFTPPDHLLGVKAADLSHAPWHKAANPYVIAVVICIAKIYWPDHGPPDLVRLGDDGIVWHIDPHHDFGVGALRHSHAIVTVLGFPVGVFDDVAVGIRTAGTVAALQLVKPRLERRVRITPVEVAPKRRQWH